MYWLGVRGIVRFTSIGWPLLYLAIPTVPFGYVLGDRIESLRGLLWALAGVILGGLVTATGFLLLAVVSPSNPKVAAQNFALMAGFVGGIAGGIYAAKAHERVKRRRRREERSCQNENRPEPSFGVGLAAAFCDAKSSRGSATANQIHESGARQAQREHG